MKVKCHPEFCELFFELQDMRKDTMEGTFALQPIGQNYSWKLSSGLRAILKDLVLKNKFCVILDNAHQNLIAL